MAALDVACSITMLPMAPCRCFGLADGGCAPLSGIRRKMTGLLTVEPPAHALHIEKTKGTRKPLTIEWKREGRHD